MRKDRWLFAVLIALPLVLHAQQPSNAAAKSALNVAQAGAVSVPVANPKYPAEFFARARQLSDLEAAGVPFHLKATYVASGDTEFTGNGTIEEWWKSKDAWRVESTLGNYKYVAIQRAGKQTSFATSPDAPVLLRPTMDAILIRVPSGTDTSNGWKMHHEKISDIDLTVLSKKYPCVEESDGSKKEKCAQQYYLGPEGLLRIRVVDAVEARYNGFQLFQNLLVPHTIYVSTDGITFFTVTVNTVETLSTYPQTVPNIPTVQQGFQPDENAISTGQEPMDASLIHQIPPIDPVKAQKRRMQGTVLLSAIIDKNGNVQELRVIQSAGTLLDNVALQTVRKWHYKPTIYQGQAVNVKTTISVIFRPNH